MMNEIVIAGPALLAAAEPVIEKSPAPIMAPIPKATRFTGPSVLFRVPSPLSAASLVSKSIDFLKFINYGLGL
ncbi:hypothetical protein D3C79_1092180 [compost metagenome]